MPDRHLLVVTGPVGGGKSTVAQHVAGHLRQASRTAAVIDLDLVYCMARQDEGFADDRRWTTARHGAAALADVFFAEGIEWVIVEGEFFSEGELGALRGSLATPAEHSFVTLVVSYGKALERVSGDPSRGLSRDPEFLRRLHAQFVAALSFLRRASVLIEADEKGPRELAEAIVAVMRGNALC